MAFLVQTVVTRLRRAYPDITEAVALELVNEVHQELCLDLPLIVTTEDITLTAGTREYALNENTLRVWAAEYVTSAADGARTSLLETDLSLLYKISPNWRAGGRGTPTRFYISRSSTDYVVGIDPNPASSTSGGYPIVRLHVSRRASDLLIGDSFPKGILKLDLYLSGAAYKWCAERSIKDDLMVWAKRYDDAKKEERRRYNALTPFKPRLASPMSFRANT